MAPHLEQIIWKGKNGNPDTISPVPFTSHKTGDSISTNAQMAHKLVVKNPNSFIEVADEDGPPCPGFE